MTFNLFNKWAKAKQGFPLNFELTKSQFCTVMLSCVNIQPICICNLSESIQTFINNVVIQYAVNCTVFSLYDLCNFLCLSNTWWIYEARRLGLSFFSPNSFSIPIFLHSLHIKPVYDFLAYCWKWSAQTKTLVLMAYYWFLLKVDGRSTYESINLCHWD